MRDTHHTTRRRWLRVLGAATLGGLAGCQAPVASPDDPTRNRSEPERAGGDPRPPDPPAVPGLPAADRGPDLPEGDVVPGGKRLAAWFANTANYEGVADWRGSELVSVLVGAAGNGGHRAFDPPAVLVSDGTLVTWIWSGNGGAHDVVSADGRLRSRLVDGVGYVFARRFERTGWMPYFCSQHRGAGMKGAVVTEDAVSARQ